MQVNARPKGNVPVNRWLIVFVATAALGIAAGSARALVEPPPARAACDNAHDLTDAENNGANPAVHRGNRPYGGMWIESANASCVRISSVFVMATDEQNWVEVGWFDAEGAPQCAYTGTGPRLLWWATDNGIYYCATQTPPALTKGQYDNFAVSDPLNDGNWAYSHSGSIFKSFTNPHFPYGVQLTNGERHSTSDQAYAEFKGLEFESDTGWNYWTNPTASNLPGTNNDPNWCNQFDSDSHIEVVSC
jgi:hypothetical protein